MQRYGTIIQFMFGNIQQTSSFTSTTCEKNSKISDFRASPKWGDLGVPIGQKVAAVTKTLF